MQKTSTPAWKKLRLCGAIISMYQLRSVLKKYCILVCINPVVSGFDSPIIKGTEQYWELGNAGDRSSKGRKEYGSKVLCYQG